MSVNFIGDTRWQQVKQAEWSVDGWGYDRASVLFRGPASGKDAFEASLQRWAVMPGFGSMKLEDWHSTIITPSYPGVEKIFVGFRSGTIPVAKPVDTLSTLTAQGSGTDTATGRKVSGTFTYRASRTTWTWFDTTLPDPVTPRYATVRNPVDPLSQIISYQLQDDTGKRNNSVPYSAFVAIFNSLTRQVVVNDYEREQIIPNALWAVRCTVDYALV